MERDILGPNLCSLSYEPMLSYNTANIAIIKISGLNYNSGIHILITGFNVQDTAKSQVVQCLNGKNFYYNFGHSPTSFTISGIIDARWEKDVAEFYYTKAKIPESILISTVWGFTGECYMVSYTRTVSANTGCFYNFNMGLLYTGDHKAQ